METRLEDIGDNSGLTTSIISYNFVGVAVERFVAAAKEGLGVDDVVPNNFLLQLQQCVRVT